MSVQNDRQLQEWSADWQGGPQLPESSEAIRDYVRRRTGFLWAWVLTDLIVGGVALPVLLYLGMVATTEVERLAMFLLAFVTVGAVIFGWWNWRGVLRASATTTAEYIAISAERLRRIRLAWSIAWLVLAAQVVVFTAWIWDHFNRAPMSQATGAEVFAWGWLIAVSTTAVIFLIVSGRWIGRDARKFEELRRELESGL